MSTESINSEEEAKKPRKLRLWLLAIALGTAAFISWFAWPSNEEGVSPWDLSREDGKSRFYATTYPKMQTPPNLALLQRLNWAWFQLQLRYKKRNPATYTFGASPVQPCSIAGLLNQCMDVSATKYLIAVEIGGAVEFGHTNTLSGAQWVAAFEHAIESSPSVLCYDFAKKTNFQDTILLIREKPGLVKVVPRSKLAEYQKAGLVKADVR